MMIDEIKAVLQERGPLTAPALAMLTGHHPESVIELLRKHREFVAVGFAPAPRRPNIRIRRVRLWNFADVATQQKEATADMEKAIQQATLLLSIGALIRRLVREGQLSMALAMAEMWIEEDARLQRMCGGVR